MLLLRWIIITMVICLSYIVFPTLLEAQPRTHPAYQIRLVKKGGKKKTLGAGRWMSVTTTQDSVYKGRLKGRMNGYLYVGRDSMPIDSITHIKVSSVGDEIEGSCYSLIGVVIAAGGLAVTITMLGEAPWDPEWAISFIPIGTTLSGLGAAIIGYGVYTIITADRVYDLGKGADWSIE